jgi:hypothetical protein
MSKKQNRIQLYDGHWSPIHNKGYHECCHCGLTHTVKYRLHEGVLFEMWTVNQRATQESRKAAATKSRRKKGKR